MAFKPIDTYKNYLLQNKDKLDTTKLQSLTGDESAMKEFIDTGSISKNYFKSETPKLKPISPLDTPTGTPTGETTPSVPSPEPILFGEAPKVPEVPKIETPVVPPTPTTPEIAPQDFTKPQETIDQYEQMRQEAEQVQKDEIKRIEEQQTEKISDTKKAFLIGRAKFDEQKANIKNYDEISNKYEAVTNELTAEMDNKGVINEATYQNIANKYGLTLDEVKNPNRIFEKTEFTEEGLKDAGLLGYKRGIDDMKKDYERRKIDTETSLQRLKQDTQYQMSQTRENMARQVRDLESRGAKTGLYRSTAFIDTIDETISDTGKVIDKMQESLNRSEIDTTKNLSRLAEDFSAALTRTTEQYADLEKEAKTSTGLSLAEAQSTYRGEKLLKALEEIKDTFAIKSQDAMQKYLNNLQGINQIAEQNLTLTQLETEYKDKEELKKYNEFLENDGLVLQQSSLGDIIKSVESGEMSQVKAENLLKIMQTSIQSTLGAISPLTQSDLTTIDNLLGQGYTPSEVVASMQEMERFKPITEQDLTKLELKQAEKDLAGSYDIKEVGGVSYKFNENTGDYEVLSGGATGNVTGDLRSLSSQFPGQAWAKNNNPAGITWNANFDNPTPGSTAQRLIDAGIKYSKGTSRPASEGGNYVTFDTIEDGLKAQRIMMSGTYGNSTVGQMLQKWVGTSEGPNYAKQVAGNAGIDVNTKVSDLSDMELEQLQMAKVQKESPGLYKLLTEDNSNMQMQALSLVQGLGGTADERQTFADNVIKVAQRDNISLADAKKKLGYKSGDDTEFAKARKEDYQSFKKGISDSTSNAKTALTLLSQPQTAIGDVASIVGFLKTIDPASVARESEVASVESARGILDSLSNVFTKAKEGTKLTPTQREQLTSAIQTIVNASDDKYNNYVTDLVAEFNDRGLDASVYIPKTEVEKVIKGQAPKGTTPTQQTGTTGASIGGQSYTSSSGNTFNLDDYR